MKPSDFGSVRKQFAQQVIAQIASGSEEKAFVIVDATELGRISTLEGVSSVIACLREDLLNRVGGLNMVVLLSNGQLADVQPWVESSGASERTFMLDGYFSREERIRVIADGLRAKGLSLTLERVRAVVEAIEAQSARDSRTQHPLLDLDQTLFFLSSALERGQIKAEEERFEDKMATLYLKVIGKKIGGPYPREVIQKARLIERVLSTSSPTPSELALDGRAEVLTTIQEKLVAWLSYGYRKSPSLPFVFLGDNGTGKTRTAEALVKQLGAASDTINFGDYKIDRYYRYYDKGNDAGHDEDDLVEVLRNRVEALRLDPNPIKILILDEVHTRRDVLEKLLPAFGDGDRRASKYVNFDGIIPILIMNVEKGSSAYNELTAHGLLGPNYPTHIFQLFKDSLGGTTSDFKTSYDYDRPDEKILAALAGRLLPGMIFFAPADRDKAQQTDLARRIIREYEQEHKIRIIAQDGAVDALVEWGSRFTSGNYRSIEKALREALSSSFGIYLANNGRENLDGGSYVLKTEKRGDVTKLVLANVGDDGKGNARVLEDSYRRFSGAVQLALSGAIATFEDNAALATDSTVRKLLLTNAMNYRNFLDALKRAANRPFLESSAGAPKVSRAVTDLCYPKCVATRQQADLNAMIEVPVKRLFDMFQEATYSDPRDPRVREHAIGTASAALVTLFQMLSVEQSGGGSDRAFGEWVAGISRADDLERAGREKARVSARELEFLEKHWKSWTEMQEAFKAEPLEAARQKRLAQFVTTGLEDLHAAKAAEQALDEKALREFFTALSEGDGKKAEEMLKARKSPREAVTAAGGPVAHAASASQLPIDAIPIAAAYLVDDIARRSAAATLADMNKAALDAQVTGHAGVALPTGAVNLTTKDCEAILRGNGDLIARFKSITGK
jgi:hypothetical protein